MNDTAKQLDDITIAAKRFMEKVQAASNARMKRDYENLNPYVYTQTHGRKYIKIAKTFGTSQTSVHSFIDKKTGYIYKPANWNRPAKTARGNVLSEQNGMESQDSNQHVRYLRR